MATGHRGHLGETLRLQDLASDLLVLKRLDAASLNLEDTVDLVVLITEETDRPTPAELTLTRDVPPPGTVHVRGQRALLTRLPGNQLENAERYAERNITIRLIAIRTEAILDVANDGPAIPAAERERIFDASPALTTPAPATPAAPASACRSPAESPPPTTAH
ncbi:hypothetical protein [Amycolatopsis sp. NPDC004169]|uniref:hypothetical protein n=1 Tax=Amycolatopsis sp. NPDC004169 TaxID=3154453 RepID=UPI0033A7E748